MIPNHFYPGSPGPQGPTSYPFTPRQGPFHNVYQDYHSELHPETSKNSPVNQIKPRTATSPPSTTSPRHVASSHHPHHSSICLPPIHSSVLHILPMNSSPQTSSAPYTPHQSQHQNQQQHHQQLPLIDLNSPGGLASSSTSSSISSSSSYSRLPLLPPPNIENTSPSTTAKILPHFSQPLNNPSQHLHQHPHQFAPHSPVFQPHLEPPVLYKFPVFDANHNRELYNSMIQNGSSSNSPSSSSSKLPARSTFKHQKSRSLPSKNMNYSPTSPEISARFNQPQRARSHHNQNSNQIKYKSMNNSASSYQGHKKQHKHDHHGVGVLATTLITKNSIHYPIHQLPAVLESDTAVSPEKYYHLKNKVYSIIEVKKYSTSAIDPFRNYLTVYEYSIHDHWIIWDYEIGFVHLTGIWKASLSALINENISSSYGPTSSNLKADIVKLLESTPKQYHPYIKRIRGGFLKIQGTWLPYKLCKILARRFCFYIRYELIPIFGADFPEYCLRPTDRGFGELKLDEIPELEQLETLIPHSTVLAQTAAAQAIADSPKVEVPKKKKSISTSEPKNKPGQAASSNSDLRKLQPNVQIEVPVRNAFIPLPPLPTVNTTIAAPPKPALLESPIFTSKRNSEPFTTNTGSVSSFQSSTSSYSSSTSLISPVASSATQPSVGSYNSLDLPYNDVIDIVNASKCLQSLSKSSVSSESVKIPKLTNSLSDSDLNYAKNKTEVDDEDDDIDVDDVNCNNQSIETKNYTISSEPYNNSGISTILLAAGLSERRSSISDIKGTGAEVSSLRTTGGAATSDASVDGPDQLKQRRVSMKINDLLT